MFREDKTMQLAARFLQLTNGRMPYMKLLKLLYLADKQMLLCRGKSIVYDRWFSTKSGPVLAATYDLITAYGQDPTYWSRYIRTDGNDVVLENDPGSDDLSRAEDRIIDDIFEKYGNSDQWELMDTAHRLPERANVDDTSKELTYRTVLEVEGLPADVIRDILDNIDAQDALPFALGNL